MKGRIMTMTAGSSSMNDSKRNGGINYGKKKEEEEKKPAETYEKA